MHPLTGGRLKSAQLLLFSLIVFLIPSNAFLKFFLDSAYVTGIMVDYLLIKLYGSDILLFILFGLWIIEIGWRGVWNAVVEHKKVLLGVAAFGALHVVTHLSGAHLVSTIWFIAKLIECWVFLAWILAHKDQALRDHLFAAASCAVIFQSLLGGYQYLAQRPFFGYWFFGEPMFTFDPTVAKSTHSGVLAILPYGTTAHPNILAGVVVMFSLVCMYLSGLKRKPGYKMLAGVLVVGAGTVAWVAESGAALAALLLGLIGYGLYSIGATRWRWLAERALAVVSVGILAAVPMLLFVLRLPLPSFVRRRELQEIAVRMFTANPLVGVGLNQFAASIGTLGTVSGTVRFLQPVHNLPLLWLAETGLAGLAFLVFIFNIVHKKYTMNFTAMAAVGLPFALLLSLDHYPLSVQSGMLMTTILLAELLEKRIDLHR